MAEDNQPSLTEIVVRAGSGPGTGTVGNFGGAAPLNIPQPRVNLPMLPAARVTASRTPRTSVVAAAIPAAAALAVETVSLSRGNRGAMGVFLGGLLLGALYDFLNRPRDDSDTPPSESTDAGPTNPPPTAANTPPASATPPTEIPTLPIQYGIAGRPPASIDLTIPGLILPEISIPTLLLANLPAPIIPARPGRARARRGSRTTGRIQGRPAGRTEVRHVRSRVGPVVLPSIPSRVATARNPVPQQPPVIVAFPPGDQPSTTPRPQPAPRPTTIPPPLVLAQIDDASVPFLEQGIMSRPHDDTRTRVRTQPADAVRAGANVLPLNALQRYLGFLAQNNPNPLPAPNPLEDLLPAQELGVRSVPQPAGRTKACDCPDPKKKQRRQCRQGYFRENRDSITYIKWSERKCPSSKAQPRSQRPARPTIS